MCRLAAPGAPEYGLWPQSNTSLNPPPQARGAEIRFGEPPVNWRRESGFRTFGTPGSSSSVRRGRLRNPLRDRIPQTRCRKGTRPHISRYTYITILYNRKRYRYQNHDSMVFRRYVVHEHHTEPDYELLQRWHRLRGDRSSGESHEYPDRRAHHEVPAFTHNEPSPPEGSRFEASVERFGAFTRCPWRWWWQHRWWW
jgi:hypothetical protein